MTQQNDTAIEYSLPGPAPWYWESFPTISSPSGEQMKWALHRQAPRPRFRRPQRASFVVLFSAERPDFGYLALATYSRPFVVSSSSIGVCLLCDDAIAIKSFAINDLVEFAIDELPFEKDYREVPIVAYATPATSLELPTSLPPGVNEIRFAEDLRHIRELLLPVGVHSPTSTDSAYSIWSLRPSDDEIHVYPQYWFTPGKFDIGYQGITRARRDPITGRIEGDGIRIASFRLAEDNCHLDE